MVMMLAVVLLAGGLASVVGECLSDRNKTYT